MSPSPSSTTSPGTSSAADTDVSTPSRRTRTTGALNCARAVIARSAFTSWVTPTAVLTSTTNAITAASVKSPVSSVKHAGSEENDDQRVPELQADARPHRDTTPLTYLVRPDLLKAPRSLRHGQTGAIHNPNDPQPSTSRPGSKAPSRATPPPADGPPHVSAITLSSQSSAATGALVDQAMDLRFVRSSATGANSRSRTMTRTSPTSARGCGAGIGEGSFRCQPSSSPRVRGTRGRSG